MEHDFVLKYQTSKISNIKTKISNNIQTLYLNKTINIMTVFTWNLKNTIVAKSIEGYLKKSSSDPLLILVI